MRSFKGRSALGALRRSCIALAACGAMTFTAVAFGGRADKNTGPTSGLPGFDEPKTKPPTTAPATKAKNAWPVMTDDELAAAVKALKTGAEDKAKVLERPLKLTETPHFLVYYDVRPADGEACAKALERAYAVTDRIFATKTSLKNVFHGKAVVFIIERAGDATKLSSGGALPSGSGRRFRTPAADDATLQDFGTHAIPGSIACSSDGNVQIVICRHPDDGAAAGFNGDGRTEEERFARGLVHRAVQGYLFRYRTSEPLPAWVRDGMAQTMATSLVPLNVHEAPPAVVAKAELWRRGGPGNFFTAESLFEAQFAVAETLANFMIGANRPAYMKFVDGLKDGKSWRESLEDNYGTTRGRLLRAYGASIGITINEPD